MKGTTPAFLRRSLVWLPLALLPSLRAQSIVMAPYRGQAAPVEAVRGSTVFAAVDGSLQAVTGISTTVQPAPLYRDGFIQIDDFKLKQDFTARFPGARGGGAVNIVSNQINSSTVFLDGYLTASQPLKNCYLVFELRGSQNFIAGHGLAELPNLAAGKKTLFKVGLALGPAPLLPNGYRIHIFSGHGECLTSLHPERAPDNRTESAFLADATDRAPAPFLLYPPEAAGGTGTAVVRCRVGADGGVLDAAALQASNPAFGAAEVAAVRQWRFTPAIQHHHFVEQTIALPLRYPPPAS